MHNSPRRGESGRAVWIKRACFAALHPARGHETEDVELKLLVWPLHGTIEDDGLAHRIAFGRDNAVGGHFPPSVLDEHVPGRPHRADVVAVEAVAVGERTAHAAVGV